MEDNIRRSAKLGDDKQYGLLIGIGGLTVLRAFSTPCARGCHPIIAPLMVLGILSAMPMISLAQTDFQRNAAFADATTLAMRGKNLSTKEVETLEQKLQATPDDLAIRTQLLGYYFFK